jgi:hypothetical protein
MDQQAQESPQLQGKLLAQLNCNISTLELCIDA